jgi:hypothetical protein
MRKEKTQMKQTTTTTERAAQPEPAWLGETPDIDYSLTMMRDGACDGEQDISLTRTEFEALKHELAVRRGYIAEDVAQEPAEAREPKSEHVRIMTEAKHPGEKIAARALVDDVRAALETFIESASANEVHLLQQALVFGATGEGGIVESFLSEIGMDMPKEACRPHA